MFRIRKQNGRHPYITFFRFIKVLWNCRRGVHVTVQMDSYCCYCGLRAEKSGNPYYDDIKWPLKSKGWSDLKRIASDFYRWD